MARARARHERAGLIGASARRAGAGLLVLLAGCKDAEVAEWECVGPLVELVTWRDELETARTFGRKPITAAALAADEKAHVATVVETLRPRRRACELTWSVLMNQPADNPGLRLREEALLTVLELPPRDYSPEAVGFAGVTVAGRRPVGP